MSGINEDFDKLIGKVQSCARCEMMSDCTRVLSWANGAPGARVMFVGEAPGRLGADRTAIPFHGDKAGDNFEKLLGLAGLSRRRVFVTNAVLCNPRDSAGNNIAPPRSVLKNCSENLSDQIDAVSPEVVVTLGSAALESTRLIEKHYLTLAGNVRTANPWNGRILIPLYHPGARAMIHRNFALQTSDYYFVGEQLRRLARPRRIGVTQAKPESTAWHVVTYVMATLRECSLFRLHKTMYLIDLEARARRGETITDFYYIRQKDGPYCVELGSKWFRSYEDQLKVTARNGIPWLAWRDLTLFCPSPAIDEQEKKIVDDVVMSILRINDSQLKTRSYLTEPMKKSLRAEHAGYIQLNHPLL